MSKTRKSEVIKYELEIKDKKISIYIFGIGNFDWNNIALENLAKESRQLL